MPDIIIDKQFHSNGVIHKETPVDVKNRNHGVEKLYRDNGRLWSTHPYEHGVLNGIEKYYNDRGEVCDEIAYKDGVKIHLPQAILN